MGYALKIKGIDFSDVALDQVEYIVPIPCTGLSLTPASLEFERAEESKQLTAIKTPADTTDSVTWTTSDENIASVNSSGLVTIHGIGTATITATCGEQTATVNISQTSIKAQYDIKVVSGRYPTNANASGGGQYIDMQTSANDNAIGQPFHSGDTDLLVYQGSTLDIECVRVPYGATTVFAKTNDDVEVMFSYMHVVDTNETVTNNGVEYPKYLRTKTFFKTNTGYAVEYGEAVIIRTGNNASPATLDYFYFT